LEKSSRFQKTQADGLYHEGDGEKRGEILGQEVYTGMPAGKGWMFSVGREGSFGSGLSEVQVQQVITSIQWSSSVISAA
jgi:hypothetical protein